MASVIVEKLASDDALVTQFLSAFGPLGLVEDFKQAKAVFIKPNLTYPCFKAGVTTRMEYVGALVGALRTLNGSTKIYIGEGEGGYNSFSMSTAMRTMKFHDIAALYPNTAIVNLSELSTRTVELRARGKPYRLQLPELFYSEIDFAISCPVPKVHCMAGLSLSLKNLWGCLPDTMRLKNHYVFDEIIGQVADTLRFRFAFLDGKYGLDSNGPIVGDPIELNWFAASNSLIALDKEVSALMSIDWRTIRHLRIVEIAQGRAREERSTVVGNAEALKKHFRLRRTFWNYPALAAFRSRWLTHLVYFSRWAGFLHSVMYTFRKRPIA